MNENEKASNIFGAQYSDMDGATQNATSGGRSPASMETDNSFLYGGKCDLKTGKCTKNTVGFNLVSGIMAHSGK